MHLTETAYGDIAEYLLDTVSGRAVVDTAGPPRKRLESILTRSASDPLQKPMPMAGLSAAARAVPGGGATCAVSLEAVAEAPEGRPRSGAGAAGADGPPTKGLNTRENCV